VNGDKNGLPGAGAGEEVPDDAEERDSCGDRSCSLLSCRVLASI
jgi:hypothetical protein